MIEKLSPENLPITINWRANRLALWEKLSEKRSADYALARGHTTERSALEYVADIYRGETRAFMAQILRRASKVGVLDFLEHAPTDWVTQTETLLEAGDIVPRLVRRAYPDASWAKAVPDLPKAKAAKDRDWRAWLDLFGEQLGQDIGGASPDGDAGAMGLESLSKWAPVAALSLGVVTAIVLISRR